jgi:hypothetical protein
VAASLDRLRLDYLDLGEDTAVDSDLRVEF